MTGPLWRGQNPAYRAMPNFDSQQVSRIAKAGAIALLVLAILSGVFVVRIWRSLPDPSTSPTPQLAYESSVDLPQVPRGAWDMIRRPAGSASARLDEQSRFRLAGTFFLYAEGQTDDRAAGRMAILDDLAQKKQMIVREGDQIEDYTVLNIGMDRVRLRQGAREIELGLSFTALAKNPPRPEISGDPEAPSMEDLPALETTRFGKRVGENRWVFQRNELLRYYAEVFDDPERIANVYASLKPKYEEGEIGGYVVNMEGEQAFFQAVGLREGDVIRRVNSMRMVSQRRAEYFLSEFMKDRLSAVVLDIERDGEEQKLIYLIR